MASYLRSSIFWTFLLSLVIALECKNGFNYEALSGLRDVVDEPVLLVKRDIPLNNNLKTKSTDGLSYQKLDKNSAAHSVSETASSVKKTLPPTPEIPNNKSGEAEADDDEVIKQFYNGSLAAKEAPTIQHDHHQYYNSTVVTEPDKIDIYWVDLTKMGEHVITHDMLSRSHRKAATISLKFDFPFYGHVMRNATIATGGFLYLGDIMHSWLASTQYVAPLMANFDTSLDDKSVIKYADNGTDFVVQWEETHLQDQLQAGAFTFQARLRYTGDIVFAYKQIPISITSIPESEHPVRVGVSDAYIVERSVLSMYKRKIIFEYHRVEINKERIANLTAVYLTALPSCITLKGCEMCVSSSIGFKCSWCEEVHRCSDGMDRHRQTWQTMCTSTNVEEMSCPKISSEKSTNSTGVLVSSPLSPPTINPDQLLDSNLSNSVSNSDPDKFPVNDSLTLDNISGVLISSSPPPLPPTTINPDQLNNSIISNTVSDSDPETFTVNDSLTLNNHLQNLNLIHDSGIFIARADGFGTGMVIGTLFAFFAIFGIVSWLIYAYKYPHSPSGQMIIKYRPSKWHWNRGEANYTPASVHI